MKKILSTCLIISFGLFAIACNRMQERTGGSHEEAVEFARNTTIVDGHVDLPYYLIHHPEENAVENEANFSYKKANAGGLNAPFMAIYVPSSYQETGGAKAYADSLIALVKNIVEEHPDKFAIATSPEEIKQQAKKGLISLAMGIENGAAIEGDLSNIEYFYNQGVRYITMAHATDNLLSDSSYDTAGTDSGLTELGKKAVKKMNQLGIMVDVSHLSEKAFYDVLEITKAPVIASHSSCRYFTPGWQRNMSDEMIKALAENGGVMMIAFGSNFIAESARNSDNKIEEHLEKYREEHHLSESDPAFQEYAERYFKENYAYATVAQVADHIDHVVNLVGINHVGFGSDFDGVGPTLPKNLSDVSELPNLIEELMDRGYTKAELRKIMHENIFRVWNKVQEVAKSPGQTSDTAAVGGS